MLGAALTIALAAGVVLAGGWLGSVPLSATAAASGTARGGHTLPPGPHPPPTGSGTTAPGNGTSTPGGNGTTGGTGTGTGLGTGGSPNGSGPSSGGSGGPGGGNGSSRGPVYEGINGTFSVGGALGNVTAAFFQLVLQTPNLTQPTLWSTLNATPFDTFQFGNAAEVTNQVTGVPYADNGSALPPTPSNDSNFVRFCRTLHCHAVMAVPAEIDNVSMAVATVRYVEKTLNFTPDDWIVGGEPQGWTHWGIPWTSWRTSDHSAPTPLEYARELQQYVTALRAYDPTIRLIGIESADGGMWYNSSWLYEVALVDGPNLTAVAIHPYPDGVGTAGANLTSFYETLSNPLNFPNNYAGLHESVDAACGCALPLWVGEYNAALAGNYSVDLMGYPDVPYLGAGLLGAMKQGVPQLDVFSYSHDPQSLVSQSGARLPSYTLFSTFFRNLTLGEVHNSTIVGGPGGLFALTIDNGSRTSFLVVSTNLTETLNLTLAPPGGSYLGGSGHGWRAWSWNDTAPAPLFADGSLFLPGTWTVPPLGILLVNVD